jgi:phosphatidylglycerophosphatase C
MDLALFDFDGTITARDSFKAFVFQAVEPRRLLHGSLRLSPLILGYYLRLVPATRLRVAIVRTGFRGRAEAEVNELGRRYAQSLSALVRPRALERISWHNARGDTVVVVSASLEPYLRPWCESLGLELICTELEAKDGVLTGEYVGGDCTGSQKAARVRARYDLSRYREIYAYGDTAEDDALLELASQRCFRWRDS